MSSKNILFKHIDRVLTQIIVLCRPLIRYVATRADLRLDYPCEGRGQHPLILEDTNDRNNIPKSVYFNTRSGKITVGKNTVFGEEVMILTGKHISISEAGSISELHAVPESGRDIKIGTGCYIGSGAIIIGPVNIDDYAVICAGAVVTKDVPTRSMVAGVPAKEIKKL